VAFAWSGVLAGPPLYGLALEATGSYGPPWLGLAAIAVLVAVVLARLQPLVQRGAT
jgi:cyanate permease